MVYWANLNANHFSLVYKIFTGNTFVIGKKTNSGFSTRESVLEYGLVSLFNDIYPFVGYLMPKQSFLEEQ